jgi:hypothetical protein
VRFSPGFFQEQDFPGSNLIRADHVGKNRFFAEQIAHPREELFRSSRSPLEQIPPWEILLLEEISG